MLILRALLYIKREFEIDEKIEEQFLEKLKSFRKKSLDELTNLKLKYWLKFLIKTKFSMSRLLKD